MDMGGDERGLKKGSSIKIGNRSYFFSELERYVGGLPGWEVWEFTHRRSGGWVSLKVFDRRLEEGRALRARVFMVGYSPAEGRMARNKDWHRLQDKYGEIAEQLQEIIINEFGNGD